MVQYINYFPSAKINNKKKANISTSPSPIKINNLSNMKQNNQLQYINYF